MTVALPMFGIRRWRIAMAALLATMTIAVLQPGASALHLRGVIWTMNHAPDRAVIDPGIDRTPGRQVRVVVQSTGDAAAAAADVRAAGGTVGAQLPIVEGFAATVNTSTLDRLGRSTSIKAVTLDRSATFNSYSFDALTTQSNFVKSSGASAAWSAGNLGDGVGVAVVDTGISNMNDLSGRIVNGPDLSGEGTTIDTFGHGTVMAGLVGGSGADSNGGHTGIAPKSWVVGVKVAGRNGAVDVSTMLWAMHWVASYKDQFNIRVMNLSWGVPSTQDPAVDPIDYAVERLWRLGIVVVVAAGNDGPNTGTITKPGDDPVILTVGAYDDKQNTDPSDDSVPSWSSNGPTAQGVAKPDIVSPGRLLIATRSFGSYVEQTYPKALYAPSYIRGSGTSEAAAVTSGLVALLLKAHPDWTPDQVKAVLKATASPMATQSVNRQGAGRVQLAAALAATPPSTTQTFQSSGLGSIDASRGGIYVQTVCPGGISPTIISGEIDIRCQPWDGGAWTGGAWTGAAWTGGAWTGAAWTGGAWTGGAWTGAAWTGGAWTGGAWTGGAWTGGAWTGAAWTGGAWTGAAWTGAAWTGAAWTGGAWTGSNFTSAVYELLLFQTAFWGMRPSYWQHLPGEIALRRPNNI